MFSRPHAVIALVAASAASAACPGPGGVQPCGQIPEDGCPIGRGGTCRDPYCAALYDCLDGRWERVEVCPGFEPSTSAGSAAGGSGGAGQGGCAGVAIDRTGETTGCMPDLALPDCTVAAAEACRPCSTGCIDFFLCTDQGWVAKAFCDQDGDVVTEP